MTKFKVGDRVKVVGCFVKEATDLTGKRGVVKAADVPNREQDLTIDVNINDQTFAFATSELELIEQESPVESGETLLGARGLKFKVGDLVRVTRIPDGRYGAWKVGALAQVSEAKGGVAYPYRLRGLQGQNTIASGDLFYESEIEAAVAPQGDPKLPVTETAGQDSEILTVDPKTGGAKGQKAVQLHHMAPEALAELGKVASMGAAKYADYNYLKGYAWSLSFDAMQRHMLAFWGGEDRDPESGHPHAAHAAWHALALCAFLLRGIGTDDRPPAFPTTEEGK